MILISNTIQSYKLAISIWTSKFYNVSKGQSLIELLVTIGLAGVLLPALLIGFFATRGGRSQQEQRQLAVYLVREAQEAVRVVRDADWTTFAALSDGVTQYHPVQAGGTWILVSPQEVVNGFTRYTIISDVYRDPTGTIVSSDGTLDPSTKKVITTVSWESILPSAVSATEYLTRNTNLSYTETAASEFQQGTYNATISVTDSSGGEVILGLGMGHGDWCAPAQNVLQTYDLTRSGVPIAITAASLGSGDLAYTTTGNNASGNSLDKITISHDTPPTVGNPDAITGPKAYGIFTDGAYVYFNENNPPNHTVVIVQASDLSITGYFDVHNGTGTSVYVSGNTGFTTVKNTLYSFDVSSKTGERPLLGSVSLAGSGNRVIVIGTNAYVVTSNVTKQLQIIDVSNPASMEVTKTVNLNNGLAGIDVVVDPLQTYAYVVTAYTYMKHDFFIVDLANSANVYGYTTINGMNPKGIIVPAVNRAIIVGANGEQYQVFDIANPASAFRCGGMSPAGVTSINAVAGVTQDSGSVFSYIITDNASAEFQIIQGGPGGSGGTYASDGVFESRTFDAGHEAAFNNFSVTADIPSQTGLGFSVAIKHGVSGSCDAFSFSDGDYIPVAPGPLPIVTSGSGYVNPGQCLRYRMFLSTTDTNITPVLYDITFNYSP